MSYYISIYIFIYEKVIGSTTIIKREERPCQSAPESEPAVTLAICRDNKQAQLLTVAFCIEGLIRGRLFTAVA